MAQKSLTLHNARNHTDYIERNLPFVDLHSGTDTPWWTLPLWGSYSFGYDTGVKMARRLLAFYGSGQVEADNNYLAHIAGSFIKRQQMIEAAGKDSESQCLRGQYSGFFGTLSKFLAPAAYMNWQGLTEENNFEPTAVRYPPAWKTPEPISLTESPEQRQPATCNQERSLMEKNQLIPVTTKEIEGEAIQTVDARTLHEFLGVETRFDKWIDRRIEKFNFVENRDFVSFDNFIKRETGSTTRTDGQKRPSQFSGAIKPVTEYALTLDMAKELCMVERNEKGRQARRYFIECEKKLRQNLLHPAAERRFDELQATVSQIEQTVKRLAGKSARRLASPSRPQPAELPVTQEEVSHFLRRVTGHRIRYSLSDGTCVEHTIGELIEIARSSPDYMQTADGTGMKRNKTKEATVHMLAQLGLRVTRDGTKQSVVEITTTYEGFRRQVLAFTRWSNARYRNTLKAIPSAYSGKGNRYFASGINTPFMVVPVRSISQILAYQQ